MWLSGQGGIQSEVGLDGLVSLFQPEFNDSMPWGLLPPHASFSP